MKTCKKCSIEKDENEFELQYGKWRRGTCKRCRTPLKIKEVHYDANGKITKKCKVCQQFLIFEKFRMRGKYVNYACIKCEHVLRSKWQKNNPKKKAKLDARYNLKHHDQIIERHKKYYKENIEKRKIYNNLESTIIRERAHRRQWKKDNPGKTNFYNSKRRAAKLKRIPLWISDEEMSLIKKFYINCPKGYTVDHIIPLLGKTISGLHTIKNLQYLTLIENSKKNNSFPYYPMQFYIDKGLVMQNTLDKTSA